jgi:hypothetical protein
MKSRSLAYGALSLLAANAAHATVLFDNVTGVTSFLPLFSTPIQGASFTAPTPQFWSIGLFVAASNSGDGGSTEIYLVPDTGTGSGIGQFGRPTVADAGGTFTDLSGTQHVGTILDSSLSSSAALHRLEVDPAITTSNDEYWVVAISSAGSSFEWSTATDGSGVGTSGQGFLNDFGTDLLPGSDSAGGYQMVVETPEPTTLVLFGMGLLALGHVRRRAA